jgi:intein/homing endonuclease
LYYSVTDDKYKQIREFNIGDKLKSLTNIRHIKFMSKLDVVVYNLHLIEEPNNYIVNGIVVHNAKQIN